MKKHFLFLGLLLIGIALLNSGCAKSCQRIEANGSFLGSTTADWVVVKTSGGVITDVYKLKNVIVQSEEGSDGWLFIDQNGNPVHIGGDMKAIRCNNDVDKIFDSYVEYHMDQDLISYAEKVRMGNISFIDTPISDTLAPTSFKME